MGDVVVSFGDETELELTAVDIGRADDDDVLAFTVEGVVHGLHPARLETFVDKTVEPTEIHFRVEDE